MTVHRLRKADIKSGTGSFHERVLRRAFKKATHVKKVRMCRGCGKPKTQCDCPKSCLEASRRYNAIIEAIIAEGKAYDREPPQHGKSLSVIDFISWAIGLDPELRVIYTSFSERRSAAIGTKIEPCCSGCDLHPHPEVMVCRRESADHRDHVSLGDRAAARDPAAPRSRPSS
jgi:hypothetical protein